MSLSFLQAAHLYSVSELNNETRQLLESTFNLIWVKGELSNLSIPKSGHWYFTLKDSQAQVRCAMFKGANFRVAFSPSDGLEVQILAKVSLYPDRGDYQLIVEKMEPSGEGKLRQAFEQLKNKLGQEGLFDIQNKKPLPSFPTSIGVITSPTGAAVQDIISVLKRRYPSASVLIYPCQVQGQAAAAEIVQAIELANRHRKCDVLLLARGGGSLEDLWPFNEENVARAVYASDLPIVSGVGHEIDFTISDFVADYRAPTPSAAAEAVSPDQSVLIRQFNEWTQRLNHTVLRLMQFLSQKIDYLDKRLLSPSQSLKNKSVSLEHLIQRLQWSINTQLQNQTQRFKHAALSLGMVNPFATLGRGYSITYDANANSVLTSVAEAKAQNLLKTRVADGYIFSTITKIEKIYDI